MRAYIPMRRRCDGESKRRASPALQRGSPPDQ